MKKRNAHLEENHQKAVVKYVNMQYPGTIIIGDASGVYIPSINLAKRLRDLGIIQKNRPDILIIHRNSPFIGIALELKKSKNEIYKKSGEFREEAHLKGQRMMLDEFIRAGFYSQFSYCFDLSKTIIDLYMNPSNQLL